VNTKKNLFSLLLFAFSISFSFAQEQHDDRFVVIEQKLNDLAQTSPGLFEKVDLSVNDVSIQEFIRGLAITNNLNISVDPSLNTKIVSNFSGVPVIDVLLFLCRKYNLDLNFLGSIINVTQYAPIVPPVVKPQRKIDINYNSAEDKISFEFISDTLSAVTKEITKATGKNIIYVPELSNKLLNGFVQDLPFDIAIQKLAFANNISITQTEDKVYQVDKKETQEQTKALKEKEKNQKGKSSDTLNVAGLNFRFFPGDSAAFKIRAIAVPISEVVSFVSEKTHKNYFLFSEIKGTANLNLDTSSYDELLKYLLNGTEYTFKKDNGIYLIGDRNLEGLRNTEVVSLKYRTVDKIQDIIPPDLKKGIDIKPFPDQNSLILSGSQPRIDELKSFMRSIDRIVPNIQIEVIIVDVQNTKTLATGIEAGLGSKPATTGGIVYPTQDLTLSSNSINNLIDGINGLGILNLGKVTPNFYLKLKALEQQGVLDLKSTPKLATLNGHEAKLSIGRTEYYLELQSSVVGVQNPFPIQSQQYKSVNADMSVTINPIVSGDDQITLDIKVKQSNFTTRISQTAPPGTITRDFQSLIRVKNEEMIILGGLDENSTNDSGSGLPLLSRIPVLKWLFSSRTRANSKNKLTIFIKPTVIY
jgi:type IV pilus assembly protein PilQ